MIDRVRRDALVLFSAMGCAATLATLGKPAPYAEANDAELDFSSVLPPRFGVWRIDEATLAFVRPSGRRPSPIYDQVLERVFVDDRGQRIMLSVAFGTRQSSNLQLHRPEFCYRFGGYEVRGIEGGTLTLAGKAVPVTRLQAEKPGRMEPITYWTLLGGQLVSDPRTFRWRRWSSAARGQLLSGTLVRISSIDANADSAFQLQGRFADELMRALEPTDRIKFIGESDQGQERQGATTLRELPRPV